MGQALYRKYRSKNFGEVVGQDHITAVLENSIKSNKVSHAYLFTGPRGVGKTSVARIFSKSVNGLKPEDNNFYPDIIEIDAASNRRIEEVRELRDKIAIAPSRLKYKVYIVDEVHMLTREAFNALLKTLEEPPAHAIFILATTDFHKVPDTIASRCMRLNFKMILPPDIVNSLKIIAGKENIVIDDEAFELIAEQSDGSFRDALSLLDQLGAAGRKIDLKLVELMLGIADNQSISKLIEEFMSAEAAGILARIQIMVEAGIMPDQINKQVTSQLRKALSGDNKLELANSKLVELIENLNSTYSYQDQRLALEIAILKSIASDNSSSNELTKKAAPPSQKMTDEPALIINPASPGPKKPGQESYTDADKLWQEVLLKLKDQNNTLYSIARMAEPSLNAGQLTLAFKFSFHLKQMELQKNKNLVNTILSETSKDTGLLIVLSSNSNGHNSSNTVKPSDKKTSDDLKAVSNIFGSAEVLES